MNIEQFEVFRTIAQVKSFTKAAKILNFTQPAISSQIKLLEQNYNATLFERCSNGVRLTEAGKKFYEYGDRILALYSEMEREIASLNGGEKEYINIGASYTAGNYYLPGSIIGFKENHPNAFIRLNISCTHEIINNIKDRSIDIGIVEGNLLYDSDLEIYNVNKNDLIFVAPATEKWMNNDAVSYKDLVNEPMISREEDSVMRHYISSYLKSHGVKYEDFNIIMEITNLEAIKQAVISNQGIAILPYPVVQKEINEGSLIKINVENCSLSWNIDVVCRGNESMTGLKEAFLKYLIDPNRKWEMENENRMKFV